MAGKPWICLAGALLGLISQLNWMWSHGWDNWPVLRLVAGLGLGWGLAWAGVRLAERRAGRAPAAAWPDPGRLWSRPWIRRGLLLCLLAILAAGGVYRATGKPVLQDQGYLTGAVYYLWYPQNFRQGFLRPLLSPAQMPALGWYSSADPAVAEQHIAWCSRYGIGFLALDWWPGRPGQRRTLERGLLRARNLGDIKFCLFYETWDLAWDPARGGTFFDAGAGRRLQEEILDLARWLFPHPGYLKLKGRPVIFFYLTRTLAGAYAPAFRGLRRRLRELGWEPLFIADEIYWQVLAARAPADEGRPALSKQPQLERMALFDGVTSYNMYLSGPPHHLGYAGASFFLSDVRAQYQKYRRACGREHYLVPGVIPGYNDRGTRPGQDHHVLPRRFLPGAGEGSFLRRMLGRVALPLVDPALNMILLTSFNEWNEDTALEPLAPAPATRRDQSSSGCFYSDGYAYAGYGTTYLEVVQDATVALAGRVSDARGRPLPGTRVCARPWYWPFSRCGTSDRRGYYNISRLHLPPGEYRVGPQGEGQVRYLRVAPGRTTRGVDFVLPEK